MLAHIIFNNIVTEYYSVILILINPLGGSRGFKCSLTHLSLIFFHILIFEASKLGYPSF